MRMCVYLLIIDYIYIYLLYILCDCVYAHIASLNNRSYIYMSRLCQLRQSRPLEKKNAPFSGHIGFLVRSGQLGAKRRAAGRASTSGIHPLLATRMIQYWYDSSGKL